MNKTIVVVPNHLPHLDFLKEWPELQQHQLIIVQDIGDKPNIPDGFDNVMIYDHDDIDDDLGENSWIIPSRTSACRSYGYYKAWQMKPDSIITLDNDCYPDGTHFISGHTRLLNTKGELGWVNTMDEHFARGFPYLIRGKSETMLNHGLWSNVPDLDGPTMLHYPDFRLKPASRSIEVPIHNFFPMCGMNLSWKTDLTPAMYFGLFGPDYGFDQYDDIWAGVLVKKVLDHLGYAARSGYPSVEHRKQSNAFTNTKKQAPALAMNEHFWEHVRDIPLSKYTIIDSYTELIEKLPDSIQDDVPEWLPKFKKAALIWASLFRS